MDVVSYIIGYQGGLKKGAGQGKELPELDNPAGAAQIRDGYEAIGQNGEVIDGRMKDAVITMDKPSIDSNGLITAKATHTEGYVTEGSTEMQTQVAVVEAATFEVSTTDRTIEGGKWLAGDIVIKGISLQEKTVTPGETAIEVTPDPGVDGLSKVTVEAVTGGGDTEEVTVDLSMETGDQVITPSGEGKVLSKVTVTKPGTMKPENIRAGIDIGGVVGEYVTPGTSKEIEPDFSAGDYTETAEGDERWNEVVVKKPETLIPENIAKDVVIGGVMGTHEGGGGGLKLSEPDWIDDVCFWDYDGTLLLHLPLADAKALTSLPTPPSHEGLVFQEWNYTLAEIQAAKYPYDVGATYKTSDGKTHLVLNLSSASYLAVPIHFMQTVANGVTIDWGDGGTSTSDATVNAATKLTHTYSAIGTYEVKITVKSSCTMTLGGGTTSTYFVGGNNSAYRNYVRQLYVGNNVKLGSYGINGLANLSTLTIAKNSQTELPDNSLGTLAKCAAIILPRNITKVGTSVVSSCGTVFVDRVNTKVSIPPTLTTVANSFCSSLNWAERIVIPPSITVLPNACTSNAYNARRIFISDAVTTIGSLFGNSARKLSKFSIPSKITSIGPNFLNYTRLIDEFIVPGNTISLGDYFLNYTGVKRLVIKGTISSSGGTNNLAYTGNNGPVEVICYQETPTSALNNLFQGLFGYADIYVPDASVDAYKTILTSGNNKYAVFPLSSYNGKLPE